MTDSNLVDTLPSNISLGEIISKAQTAVKDGKVALALDLFSWALKNRHPTAELYFHQSCALFSAGQMLEGIKAMEAAYHLKPNDGFYIINFALALLKGNLVDHALPLIHEVESKHMPYRSDARRLRVQIREQDRLSGITR